jgi:hypothetical protein
MPTLELYFETIAGAHLTDALEALRDAGSSDGLYDRATRDTSRSDQTYDWVTLVEQEAIARQVVLSRRALLYAAFAAEAYVNEFLSEHFQGADRETLDRLPTVEKYVLLPRLVRDLEVLRRGHEPMQRLVWLFHRRNELVHPKPDGKEKHLDHHPEDHNPDSAAQSIVAVAEAAAVLESPDGPHRKSMIARVQSSRARLLSFGREATSTLPRPADPPAPPSLLA